MKGIVEERAIELGEYIIESKATVRKAAKKFGVSKSTVHKDVAERLKYVDPQLYKRVKTVLEINKAQRHIRGGLATNRNTGGTPDRQGNSRGEASTEKGFPGLQRSLWGLFSFY